MAVSPVWTFTLADMQRNRLADLTLTKERKITTRLNRPTSLEVTMEMLNPAMSVLMNEPNQHLLIQARRNGTLITQSEIAAGDMAGAAGTIKLSGTCTAYARLIPRHIGTVSPREWISTRRATVASQALGDLNTDKDTLIVANVVDAGATGLVSAGPYGFKPFFELLNEIGESDFGYDHYMVPDASTAGLYGTLYIQSIRGTAKPNVVFEYGTGQRNARDWGLKWDTASRITRAISLPPGTGYSPITRPTSALTAIEDTEGIGRREAIVESDLYNTSLRTALLDEHIAVRQNPRQLFVIQPAISEQAAGQPQPFVDYDVGDIIEGRVYDNGVVYLDAQVRIYGITITLDENGTESVELLLINED